MDTADSGGVTVSDNSMISQYNWTDLYNCMDIENATEHFYIVLNTFFNECVPDRFPSKLNRPPWFTNALQRLKNLKLIKSI